MQPQYFNPAAYGPDVAALLAEPRLAALGPGSPELEVHVELRRFDPLTDLGGTIVDRDAALACHAGLWLYFDYLDESHTLSQELETPEGSFWHAIMHRREPDPSNSKFWWHRVGNHPVFAQLVEAATRLGWKAWDPVAFVDACENERGSGSERETLLREVQRVEWELLFAWCYGLARGRSATPRP